MRKHVSYANVVATLALFVALGGAGYAAVQLPKNSVGSKQIKKNAVIGKKVRNHSLTGADLNLGKLGKVPSAEVADHASAADHASSADQASSADHATTADTAGTASNLAPPEPWHKVGAAGEPAFEAGAGNYVPFAGNSFEPVGFFKDHEGVVHLKGMAVTTADGIFRLPAGYRPADGKALRFTSTCHDPCPGDLEQVTVQGGGFSASRDGMVQGATAGSAVSLDGITFRADG